MLLLNPLITALGLQAIFNQKFCSRPSTLRLRAKPLLSRSVIIQARKSSSIFSVSGNFLHTSIDRASKSDLVITLIKTYYHSMLRRTVSKRRVDVPRITSQSIKRSGGAVSAANRSWHPVELFQPPIGLASNAPLPLPLPEHSADVSESLPLGAASSPPPPSPPLSTHADL
jgi:hypothetical protein